jgi:large subunit ribosomal protein L21
MYAVIEVGGHQEKVEVGSKFAANRVAGAVGETLTFVPILVVQDDKVVTDTKALKKSKVDTKIVSNFRGPKLHIMRFKNKTRQHTRRGHRQELTSFEVTGISV